MAAFRFFCRPCCDCGVGLSQLSPKRRLQCTEGCAVAISKLGYIQALSGLPTAQLSTGPHCRPRLRLHGLADSHGTARTRPLGRAPALQEDQGHQQGKLWLRGAGGEPGDAGAGGNQVHTRGVSDGRGWVGSGRHTALVPTILSPRPPAWFTFSAPSGSCACCTCLATLYPVCLWLIHLAPSTHLLSLSMTSSLWCRTGRM